jgi:hypothetical protein
MHKHTRLYTRVIAASLIIALAGLFGGVAKLLSPDFSYAVNASMPCAQCVAYVRVTHNFSPK